MLRLLTAIRIGTSFSGVHGLLPQTGWPARSGPRRPGVECAELPESVSWGVFVDGKDGGRGPDAYSSDYRSNMQHILVDVLSLEAAFDSSGHDGRALFGVFKRIAGMLFIGQKGTTFGEDGGWLDPMGSEKMTEDGFMFEPKNLAEIANCLPALDEVVRRDIFTDIVTRDSSMKYITENLSVENATEELFERYWESQSAASDEKARLANVAWLMRNLAFLHPLWDRNGRSRLLLLQFELRRQGLACGSMMYNNNKDIYFDSRSAYLEKITEGIRMYRDAEHTQSNPWESAAVRATHEAVFQTPYGSLLEKCWKMNGPGGGTSVKRYTVEDIKAISEEEAHRVVGVARYGYGRGLAKEAGAFNNDLPWQQHGWVSYYTLDMPGLHFDGQRNPVARHNLLRGIAPEFDFVGKSLLDVGSNMGGMLFPVADQIRWGVGVDFDGYMVNAGNRISAAYKFTHIRFYQLDLQQDDLEAINDFLPADESNSGCAENCVDVATMYALTRWLNNWKAVVQFLYRTSRHLIMEVNYDPAVGKEQYVTFLDGLCQSVRYVRDEDILAQCGSFDCSDRKLLHCFKAKEDGGYGQ